MDLNILTYMVFDPNRFRWAKTLAVIGPKSRVIWVQLPLTFYLLEYPLFLSSVDTFYSNGPKDYN